MFFKFTGQAFLIPAGILALGFFIMYTSTRIENRLENKGIKLYAFFTVALLWVCAIFLLLGGIIETDAPAAQTQQEKGNASRMIPMPPHSMPPSSDPENPDEEMSLNPDKVPDTSHNTQIFHRSPHPDRFIQEI